MKKENASRNSGMSETSEMTTASDTVQEASFKLGAIAMPGNWSDTRAASLRRAAARLRISPSQAKRIIYRECKRIDAHVLDNIRAAYQSLEAKAERIADEQQKIAITLRREIEGRTYAATADNSRGHSELAGEPSCKESETIVGEG